MTTEMIQAIWKNPDDRTLLAVYADWLASTGETTRAEYMQLGLLTTMTQAQQKSMTALRLKHRGAWLGPARPFVWTWEEDWSAPGFIAKAQCAMGKLTRGFELVRALGPRLVVHVTAPKARREAVAFAEKPIGTLYGLGLREADAQWVTDDLLQTLAPSMRGLRALELIAGEARATEAGWTALLPHLEGLEHLVLRPGWNPEAWFAALLDSNVLRTLKTLSVPSWVDKPTQAQLEKAVKEVTFRPERREQYNRATGQYT
jgi:uncharacterized protein (TIGR02996 family)